MWETPITYKQQAVNLAQLETDYEGLTLSHVGRPYPSMDGFLGLSPENLIPLECHFTWFSSKLRKWSF